MSQTQLLQPEPSQRSWLLWPALSVLPGVLLFALLLPLPQNGAIAGLPSICMFHLTTGLPCPGCGLTRSIVSCAHGQWSEAAYYHPMGPALFATFVAAALVGLLHLLAPERARRLISSIATHTSGKWPASVAGALLIGIWLARLAGWLPSPP